MHLLIIEDDRKTSKFIARGFSECGYSVDTAEDGVEGLRKALAGEYDIIVLDMMLPKLDGWAALAQLRSRGCQTPVIIVTACDTLPERLKGLEIGADDYLVKPFSFSELLARVTTILRRGPTLKQENLRVGDLEIDLPGHRAMRGGKRLDLTPKEFALLSLLMRKTGEVLSRVRIAEQIWDIRLESDSNVVDVHMRRLRSKVDDPYDVKLIHTVRGSGYVLEVRE